MARQSNAIEFNNFVAGLITEATPLNFPDNASLDEDNFVLNTNGSRQRRLGMDFENGSTQVGTNVYPPVGAEVAFTTTKWTNAGGDPLKTLIVVQTGNEIRVFDSSSAPLSEGLIYNKSFDVPLDTQFSYAVVDGVLIMATGQSTVASFKYTSGSITYSALTLLVRDLFGLEEVVEGVNLKQGSGVVYRPTTVTSKHVYNLRNQTFALPRLLYGSPSPATDTITNFVSVSGGKLPSNSDSVVYALYANTAYTPDPVSKRFKASELIDNPIGTFPAPKGYFIIDALSRGPSRVVEYNKLRAANPSLGYPIASLPSDTTPGGASVVAEYAGRVWYGGFSGTLIDGDESSPRMASYLLFSQLVEDASDIVSCYQDGDPTSTEVPELLDSDGGFLRVEGAYGIVAMVSVGTSLMVVASNGVWSIRGGSDYGFKATNYLVSKISNRGCTAPGSVVVIDNSFMFWGDDGIYNVAPNQFGEYIATNITERTIQTFYNNIDGLDRKSVRGVYDSYERKAKWVYRNRLNSVGDPRELVLDIALGAFYPNTIGTMNEDRLPMVTSGVQVPPYNLSGSQDAVTVLGDIVTTPSGIVTITDQVATATTRETVYISLVQKYPNVVFAFSQYNNDTFTDWVKYNGVGRDAPAYLLTGWTGGGDFQRNKQVPYVNFHFTKTEDGFDVEFVPLNQSSCLVSAQWDWSNSANSGQWGKKFQAYRFKRHYIPATSADTFDNGYSVVNTKNKLRGKGKVLSMLIETEPKRDLRLLGWSMMMGSNANV